MSILSFELLFWIPAVVDLMLLVGTFGFFYTKGVTGYLSTLPPSQKVDFGDLSKEAKRVVDLVWDVLMIAYAAYGVLLPLSIYWAGFVDQRMRFSFCIAMTVLMFCKVTLCVKKGGFGSPEVKEKLRSLVVFDIPCYGGYVLWKTISA